MDTTADLAIALLIHYSFDLSGYTAGELIDYWLQNYPASWIRLAVIEALYQGRYKGVSVEQILAFWKRRGQVAYHFNHEFERLVCSNFPQTLTEQPHPTPGPSPTVTATLPSQQPEPAIPTASAVEPSAQGDNTAVRPSTNKIAEESAQSQPTSNNNPPALESQSTSSRSIKQFAPTTDSSDFYTKLKVISRRGGERSEGKREK